MRFCCIEQGTTSDYLRWSMMEDNVKKKNVYICVCLCVCIYIYIYMYDWVTLLYSRN